MNEAFLSEVFLKIINMSISASWLILAVVLLRLVLKKAPKWISVFLWGFVAIRLICPFSIESMLSLIPSAETVSPDIMMDWTPEISTGIGSVDTVINPIITQVFASDPATSVNPLQILIPVAGIVWLAGIAIMLLYTAISYFLLQRKVATAVLLRKNIYQSENVDSPFVLGIIKPKIYLPFRMDSQNLDHILAHEEAHICRKDHWWKPLGFVLLALYWFNPLMWLAYVLLCRDIELACDEKVIQQMDNEAKADYTQALVASSVNRRSIAACPLAFGEVGVKERVRSVMNYKKPTFWIIVAAVIACIALAVCFLTNPKTDGGELADPENLIVVDNDTGRVISGEIDGVPIIQKYTTELGTYFALEDGTWMAGGHRYLYRLVITGRMPNAVADTTFVYLSNMENISFEQAWMAAGFSSNTENYFSADEAVLVEFITDGGASVTQIGGADHPANGVITDKNGVVVLVETIDKAISEAILEKNAGDAFLNVPTGLIPVEAHAALDIVSVSGTPLMGQTEHKVEIVVYIQYVYHRYSYSNGKLEPVAGTGSLAKLTFARSEDGQYTLKEFWEPNEGSLYAEDIRKVFPEDIADMVLNPESNAIDTEALEAKCLTKAQEYVSNFKN